MDRATDAFSFAAEGRILGQLAGRGFEEGDMETDGRALRRGRNATSHPYSTTLGMRAPRLLSRHARSQTIGLGVAFSEDGAPEGKGGLG
jgi:hypothetical protein